MWPSPRRPRTTNFITRFNIHKMRDFVFNIPGFIWKITTFPDLVCTCGGRSYCYWTHIVLSYNRLCDLYAFPYSSLTALFSKSCTAMFLLHERKIADTHRSYRELGLFKSVQSKFQYWKRQSVPLLTDREKSFLNAATSVVPTLHVLHCWNHGRHYWVNDNVFEMIPSVARYALVHIHTNYLTVNMYICIPLL